MECKTMTLAERRNNAYGRVWGEAARRLGQCPLIFDMGEIGLAAVTWRGKVMEIQWFDEAINLFEEKK